MAKLSEEQELARQRAMLETEQRLHGDGYRYVAGVDEAGRGPLAGPVYAAAVILPENVRLDGINDSKKLSPKKRDELFDKIKEIAVAYSVCAIDEKIIDEVNILNATYMAMNCAVDDLAVRPDYVVIDGNGIKGMTFPHETIVKGDAKSMSIAAASILAKVSRDRYIVKIAEEYPEYGFEKHKGYGTKAHTDAILKYGLCPIHRRTFLKKLLGRESES